MLARLRSAYQETRWRLLWDSFQLPQIELNEILPNAMSVEPTITERLCLPPYQGPDNHNDAVPLLALVQELKPNIVLELGTAHGALAANICAISGAKVYTVNALPEQMGGKFITFSLSKDDIGYVYRKAGFSDRVVQIYENTWQLDLRRYVPSDSVDFAIIDACHDSDFVINDFLCLLPVLNRWSVVLFHDVHPSMTYHLRDGYIACMYLRKLGFNVQHLKNTWWGVWRAEAAKPNTPLLRRAVSVIENLMIRARGQCPFEDVKALVWYSHLFAAR